MSTLVHSKASRPRRQQVSGWALLAAILWWWSASFAECSDEPVSSEAVAAAVRDLGADSLATRKAGEQALLAMGPDVLDLLPPVDVIETPAVREAVRRIRTQLELQAARQSLRPKTVTLAGSMTLREAATEIGRQSGNVVLVDQLPADAGERRISVALNAAPFWDSLAELQQAAGISWELVHDPPAVALIPQAASEMGVLASTSSGSFRVGVESVTSRSGVIRVQFQIVAEPRLRPLFLQIADADFEATIGEQRLALFSPEAKTELPIPGRAPASFAVLFVRPPDTPRDSMLFLKGRLRAETAAGPTEFHFRDFGGTVPVARRRGGVTVTLQRARYLASTSEGHHARIRLSVVYDAGGPAFESHRTWIYHNEVYLQADDGKRYAVNDGFDTTAETNGGVAVEYRFKDLPELPPAAWELVYVAPTLLIEAPVEFEFRGLLVPPVSETNR